MKPIDVALGDWSATTRFAHSLWRQDIDAAANSSADIARPDSLADLAQVKSLLEDATRRSAECEAQLRALDARAILLRRRVSARFLSLIDAVEQASWAESTAGTAAEELQRAWEGKVRSASLRWGPPELEFEEITDAHSAAAAIDKRVSRANALADKARQDFDAIWDDLAKGLGSAFSPPRYPGPSIVPIPRDEPTNDQPTA